MAFTEMHRCTDPTHLVVRYGNGHYCPTCGFDYATDCTVCLGRHRRDEHGHNATGLRRITNYAYAKSIDLFAGMDVMTAQELYEERYAAVEYEIEAHIDRTYGDCGAPLYNDQYYAEHLADEARAAMWG